MEVDVTFRRGAWTAGVECGITAGPRENEAFDGPRFTSIKASPDGALFAGWFLSIDIAKDENVLSINGKANEAAHTAIGTVLMSVGKNIDDTKIFPGVSTIGGSRFTAARVFWALLPVDSRVVVK